MFGSDVVVGTLWDLVRNGISPYLDRVGLDDYASKYEGFRFDLLAVGTRSESPACPRSRRPSRPRASGPRATTATSRG